MLFSILMFPSRSPNADNLLLRRKLYPMSQNNIINKIPLSEDCILNISHSQLPHHLFTVVMGPYCLECILPVTQSWSWIYIQQNNLQNAMPMDMLCSHGNCHFRAYCRHTHAGKGIISVGKLKPQNLGTLSEVKQ